MTDTDREALRTWLALLTASNAIKKETDAALREEFGMSLSRFDILSALERAGPEGLRAGDLSKRLLVTEGATTQVATPLVRAGLVKRTPCANDGRAVIFTLTRKGEKLFRKMAQVHRGWIAKAFADFSPKQISSLHRLIEKIDLPQIDILSKKDAA